LFDGCLRRRSNALTRFPPPWTVEEGERWFVVSDRRRPEAAYVYFDDPRAAAELLTRDEARRIAANIAELPQLLRGNR
jgi:hypothetical protein